MINISYILGCRTCSKTDGVRTFYMIRGENAKKLQQSREYEMVKIIERWREEDNKKCLFCNSGNVEVYDVEVNDVKLYDFNRLSRQLDLKGESLFILNFLKSSSGIVTEVGGSEPFHRIFLKRCLEHIEQLLAERPARTYEKLSKGHFNISLSGSFNFMTDTAHSHIERLQYTGFSIKELQNEIQLFRARYNIS